MAKENWIRWSFFIVGLCVLALGIAMTIEGKRFGIVPWDVFHYGLYTHLGLTVGTWSIIVGLLILFMYGLVKREIPKIGAWLNMLLLGLFIDFFLWILPEATSLFGETLYFIPGVIILGYGIGIYISADLGAGPRDSMMLLFVEKFGWSVKAVRNGMELTVFLFGWLLGGPIGIGTILIVFFLGSIVNVSLHQSKLVLAKILEKENRINALSYK
ncbi:YczE/YyaS/YitT family protein [Bacillus coahuilensis]|uniref:YczE/YyaS/YitT family protein n=1 Tax=Bacillus coahuilensis TaxID=408580 RepID=UPI0001850F87|nr:membrane protein [Bacillus coahuilensis]